jgi:hypothetical protein
MLDEVSTEKMLLRGGGGGGGGGGDRIKASSPWQKPLQSYMHPQDSVGFPAVRRVELHARQSTAVSGSGDAGSGTVSNSGGVGEHGDDGGSCLWTCVDDPRVRYCLLNTICTCISKLLSILFPCRVLAIITRIRN